MKIRSIALALAVAAGGLVAGQSFAQDRDVTITRDTPHGVVTKHIRRSEDGVVHRVVRVQRPDGTTVIRRSTHVAGDGYGPGMHRSTVIHRRYEPRRVVVRTVRERPAYVVHREVREHDAY